MHINVLVVFLLLCFTYLYITNKTFLEKIKCDVGMLIDCDVAEKRYENKVGKLLSYTHWPLIISFNAPPSDRTQ